MTELDEEPTESGIRAVLSNPSTSNAILWVTPEVAESSMIRMVEAPGIVERFRKDDGFFVIPVAAGGLTYEEAADAVSGYIGVEDLKTWNIRKVASDPVTHEESREVAYRVLIRRLEKIHAALADDVPLKVVLNTRNSPPFQPGKALIIDWTHRFEGREATPEVWSIHLLPAITWIANAIQQRAPGRRIEASGLLSIPAAISLGHAFSAPKQLEIAWEQFTPGRQSQMWSLAATPEHSSFEASCIEGRVDSSDLGVMVSVNTDVSDAVFASGNLLPSIRAYAHIGWQRGSGTTIIEGPSEAAGLAGLVISEIRQARTKYHISGRVHLFMAIPVGVAMMIGQLLNTLGEVQTYEHIQEGAIGHYRPAALLRS